MSLRQKFQMKNIISYTNFRKLFVELVKTKIEKILFKDSAIDYRQFKTNK